jgi:nicotinamide mononucleotide (NMN) deamidase PncC
MAAPDPVACWGAAELMRREFGLPITAVTGPATDNEVGQVYITGSLGLPAHNARRDAAGLVQAVRAAIAGWAEKSEGLAAAAAS